ncbi:MAG: DUF2167 domain-containing protein [Chitinophagaceae bacterium]|nr:MAG: DUF2167 domain-containing protein [Chitinophagaceae bacterium]
MYRDSTPVLSLFFAGTARLMVELAIFTYNQTHPYQLLMKSFCLSVLLLCTLFVRAGEPGDSSENAALIEQINRIAEIEKGLKYQTGRITLQGGIATVNLPKGFRFLGPEDSRKIIEDAWGNLKGGDAPLGMIVPGEDGSAALADYAFIVQYEGLGYVKDNDADKINYDDLLKQMKEDGVAANEERRKQGLNTLELIGWASKPHYDKEGKVLYWAKEFRVPGSEENTLNYDIRVLGRKGVLVLQAVAGMSQLDTVNAHIKEVLGMVAFEQGHRYTDFDSNTDEVAAWTIGGLVAGKVLAKVGFFAIILKYLKLIIVGIVAIAGGIWKRITGRKKDDGTEQAPTEPEPTPAETEVGQ